MFRRTLFVFALAPALADASPPADAESIARARDALTRAISESAAAVKGAPRGDENGPAIVEVDEPRVVGACAPASQFAAAAEALSEDAFGAIERLKSEDLAESREALAASYVALGFFEEAAAVGSEEEAFFATIAAIASNDASRAETLRPLTSCDPLYEALLAAAEDRAAPPAALRALAALPPLMRAEIAARLEDDALERGDRDAAAALATLTEAPSTNSDFAEHATSEAARLAMLEKRAEAVDPHSDAAAAIDDDLADALAREKKPSRRTRLAIAAAASALRAGDAGEALRRLADAAPSPERETMIAKALSGKGPADAATLAAAVAHAAALKGAAFDAARPRLIASAIRYGSPKAVAALDADSSDGTSLPLARAYWRAGEADASGKAMPAAAKDSATEKLMARLSLHRPHSSGATMRPAETFKALALVAGDADEKSRLRKLASLAATRTSSPPAVTRKAVPALRRYAEAIRTRFEALKAGIADE